MAHDNGLTDGGIDGSTTRRDCLERIAAAGATTGLLGVGVGAGAGGAAAAGSPGCRREFDYDSVVDVVEAGADPSGENLVDPVLEEHTADDTLLHFPEGQYRVGEYHFSDLTNFGLCGKDATLLPEDGEDGTWIFGQGLENFQFEGLTIDNTAPETGPRVMFYADDGLVVRDVRKRGVQNSTELAFRFQIETEDGSGLVERLEAPDGASAPEIDANGVLVAGPPSDSYHVGHLTFKDCHIEGFMDNGLYASGPEDPASIHVIGGVFRNNNISNVLLGQENSFVKNALVEVTEAPDYWQEGVVVNMRGIRVADGAGVTIKNCDVAMTADVVDERFWSPDGDPGTVHTSGAITGAHDAGGFTVKNTDVRMDMDGFTAVQVKDPNEYEGDADTGVTFKNVSITGSASAANHTDSLFTDAPTILVDGRDPSTFKNMSVVQTGDDRDGFEFLDSDATVRNVRGDVTGEPIVSENSDVDTKNVRL